jgi:hypothetical protein
LRNETLFFACHFALFLFSLIIRDSFYAVWLGRLGLSFVFWDCDHLERRGALESLKSLNSREHSSSQRTPSKPQKTIPSSPSTPLAFLFTFHGFLLSVVCLGECGEVSPRLHLTPTLHFVVVPVESIPKKDPKKHFSFCFHF